MTFSAQGVAFHYGLVDATFRLPERGLVAIGGPNGAGKSTLIGILAGVRTPYKGSCKFDEKELRTWRRRDFAKKVAFVPQLMRMEFSFTALEVVHMGRGPHATGWQDSPLDDAAVQQAIARTNIEEFVSRDFRGLSGGERQRVLLASALAQQTPVLLMDEPATFLDLKHQMATHTLLEELARDHLVVVVTHDLDFVTQGAAHLLMLQEGRVVAEGPPRELLTTASIAKWFDIDPRALRRRMEHETTFTRGVF